MRKHDIAKELKVRIGLPIKKGLVVVDTIFEAITCAVAKGDSVIIRGFGRFEKRKYDPRNFRNPTTGEIVPKGAYSRPWFRSSKLLRARVNGGNLWEVPAQLLFFKLTTKN